jgi:hypothetical protein
MQVMTRGRHQDARKRGNKMTRNEYLAKISADKARRSARGNGTAVKHDYAPATEAQENYAKQLAARAGYRFLSEAAKACFGRSSVGGIKRAEMSRLIEWLKEQ